MSAKHTALLSLLLLPLLVACAGNPENPTRRPPDYAIPVGMDSYEVRCGAVRVFVSYTSVDVFFNDDGTTKTQEAFCEENRSDTSIRR
ncbi:MAG: hypothetical protein Q7W55_10780 [Pseudohongiella sp.]|nr:hypothetical protein [Pseudohongiella sp.]MDO9519700.1 hypothetical protein [Pseudohongiella sp.]MDP2128266.1 hypothetical protein [Pseudohongiella sp.]